jgi:hypothetical protein
LPLKENTKNLKKILYKPEKPVYINDKLITFAETKENPDGFFP